VKAKVAFIAGGAIGIGLSMAKVFVRAGMKAVIAESLSWRK
jgi:NAD(P)-dependent dehydrogenase (short-subunit alcohol dehydrogenase family)